MLKLNVSTSNVSIIISLSMISVIGLIVHVVIANTIIKIIIDKIIMFVFIYANQIIKFMECNLYPLQYKLYCLQSLQF